MKSRNEAKDLISAGESRGIRERNFLSRGTLFGSTSYLYVPKYLMRKIIEYHCLFLPFASKFSEANSPRSIKSRGISPKHIMSRAKADGSSISIEKRDFPMTNS